MDGVVMNDNFPNAKPTNNDAGRTDGRAGKRRRRRRSNSAIPLQKVEDLPRSICFRNHILITRLR